MRIAAVLLITPLAARRAIYICVENKITIFVIWLFAAVPAVSLFFDVRADFIVGTYGSFLAGGMAIILLSALNEKEFWTWTTGVGLVAICFLILGLNEYGLEQTTYYGAPRSHMGFLHPTQTASVIIMAGLFVIRFIRWYLRTIPWLLWLTLIGTVAGMFFLLVLARSRNSALAAFLVIGGAICAKVIKKPIPLLGIILVLLSATIVGYAISATGDMQGRLWLEADSMSSGRITSYRELLESLSGVSPYRALVGSPVPGERGGFAYIDSAYISVFMNFGFLSLVNLFIFLCVLGWRLSKMRQPLAYGCLCAVIVFFAIDAQGITPSNLAVFLLLVYAVRTVISHSLVEVKSISANRSDSRTPEIRATQNVRFFASGYLPNHVAQEQPGT